MEKKKKKGTVSTVILILILIAGLSLVLYPTVSDYVNSLHQSRAIAGYNEAVSEIDDKDYKKILESARAYNKRLYERGVSYELTDEEKAEYNSMLKVPGTDVMGYVEVPSINCTLPIYHGTDEAELQVGVGHLEWTSLPVGGENTHCVLSGHRGLPSAKLFTNLNKVGEGDIFMVRVLDEVLTYEVDQIRIVKPDDTSDLQIVKGKDYCTLMTCTPYGVNSHRLLVRGHRIDNLESSNSIRVTSDAVKIDPLLVAPLIAIPLLIIVLIIVIVKTKKSKKKKDKNNKKDNKEEK